MGERFGILEEMGRRFVCFFVFLVFCLVLPPGVGAQEVFEEYGLTSRFGPHLACSNQTDFIEKVRKNYKFLGWEKNAWVPATIMFKITDPPGYIRAGIQAMIEDFEDTPKLWPIIRLDGDPHGDRISEGEIIQFRETLKAIGRLGSLGNRPIFFEFANEPNHLEEWKPAIDPGNYRDRLGDFIREVGVVRDVGGFRVLNAAMDQRAGDSPTTMEAVSFWDAGNLRSIVGSLDGYAFNNYHFEDTGRHSKEGWKEMRVSFGMTEDKPVFLVEYGLDPGAKPGERISFLRREYQLDLEGVNLTVEEVTAITPLFCLDDDPNDENSCPKKNTAIFGVEGELLFMEQDETGSCGELLSCCGLPAEIRTARCAKEVSECRARALLPAKLVGKTRFESAAAGVGSGDVAGVSTLGVREKICSIVDRIPGLDKVKGVLCEFAEVSDHLALVENPQEVGERLEEPRAPEVPAEPPPAEGVGLTGVGVQGFSPVDWIWRIIAPRTVEEETGWLGQYAFSQERTVDGTVRTMAGVEEEVIGEFDRTQQKLTPWKLLAGNGRGPGTGEPGVGTCQESTREHCTAESLRPYFGDQAGNASQVCSAESLGGDPGVTNKACLPANGGRTRDYSIGLFQINLLSHCRSGMLVETPHDGEVFGNCDVFQCERNAEGVLETVLPCVPLRQDLIDKCEAEMKIPSRNIEEAVRISGGGANWCPWGGAYACNIVNCQQCGLDPESEFCQKYGN